MKRILLVAVTACLMATTALAQDSEWTIGSRALPAPAGASDAVRAAIANTPQPDVAKHIQNTTFTTLEEWVQFIRAGNAVNVQRAVALAVRWTVTIAEDKIAGVTVRTVTPSDIDPANEDRLFVHVHGGAYVLGGGRASLPEAIVIAHRAKILVLSAARTTPGSTAGPSPPFSPASSSTPSPSEAGRSPIACPRRAGGCPFHFN